MADCHEGDESSSSSGSASREEELDDDLLRVIDTDLFGMYYALSFRLGETTTLTTEEDDDDELVGPITDADFAGVVQRQGPIVPHQHLNLNLGGRGDHHHGWDRLLHSIQTVDLDRITIREEEEETGRSDEQKTSTDGLIRFSHAIRQNVTLTYVELKGVRLNGAVVSTLLDSSTFATLCLGQDLHWQDAEQDMTQLAQSLHQNEHIKCLIVSWWSNKDQELVSLFDALASIPQFHLQELMLVAFSPRSAGPWKSLQKLFSSASNISSFQIQNLPDMQFDTDFHTIAQSLINSPSITELSFRFCTCLDSSSATAFKDILTKKPNLKNLTISSIELLREDDDEDEDDDDSDNSSRPILSADEAAAIIQPSLCSLDMQLRNIETLMDGDDGFVSLLRAVETSNLSSLSLDSWVLPKHAKYLAQSIPKMKKLRSLYVEFDEYYEEEIDEDELVAIKADFIEAVTKNGSLTELTVEYFVGDDEEGQPYFNEEGQQQVLEYCAARNLGMDAWIANPNKIPQGAWSNALFKGLEAGPDKIFLALRAIASKIGNPVVVKGKRKRPS